MNCKLSSAKICAYMRLILRLNLSGRRRSRRYRPKRLAQVAQAIQDGQTKFAPDPLWMILDRINSMCCVQRGVLYDLGEVSRA